VLAAVSVLVSVAIARIVVTYPVTAQTFDEPCHVSAAIEFLDKGTYSLDPVHPPLARVAIGLPLYLAGERFPNFPADDPRSRDYNEVGNRILYEGGHYRRNLALARLGMLPFLLFAVVIVFLWTRHEFGDIAALIAVALFTTLPIVLALSSVAYTDMAAASTQTAALFAFALWLRQPTKRNSIWLGVAVGLALLAKLSALVFLSAAGISIGFCRWAITRGQQASQANKRFNLLGQGGIALLIAIVLLWSGYRFSVGHVQTVMQITPQNMPSFQHFPGPVRGLARKLVIWNPSLPAPEFFRGFAGAWVLNASAPQAYLLGKARAGGWWYFFLVGLAVKATIPLLVLTAVGCASLVEAVRARQWTPLVPIASAVGILISTMFVKYNAGVRHVLVFFPLLAIVAGAGGACLWRAQGTWRWWARLALAGLLAWQGISTFVARHDYIAYFNELAGSDPSRVLVAGCDLDCGQDVFRLAAEFHARNVSHAYIAIWSSADMTKMDLPDFAVPQPFQPVTGWYAISLRALRLGDLFHTTYPPGAFAWLRPYQPVARVGKTILLYHIPENPIPPTRGMSSSGLSVDAISRNGP
jgi:4-amino-4-deoxy-L-arabinose transferase-like glycosyltransferase